VGTGGGNPPPVTRWARSNARPYRDRFKSYPRNQFPVVAAEEPLKDLGRDKAVSNDPVRFNRLDAEERLA